MNRTNKPREHCGVFGVFGHRESAALTYLGLYALQHRGQESAGISVSNRKRVITRCGMGRVTSVFKPHKMGDMSGDIAIGHVRYSTTGSNTPENAQPITVRTLRGTISAALNGNFVNTQDIRVYLEDQGSIFHTTVDTEIILHLMGRSKHADLDARLMEALMQIKGAYSLVIMDESSLVAARDPFGFRPLCLGKKDDAYFVASETCALDIVGAKYIRDINPGEIMRIDNEGITSEYHKKQTKTALCIFEYIYFSRPDSIIFNNSVHYIREKLGQELAKESPSEADMVVPVPDSSNAAALGYSTESNIPLKTALIRNHYIGRTFIAPTQSIRNYHARLKYNPVASLLKDKRIVLVDDSIMRGTTSKQICELLRGAGVKEIHMCISAPPTVYPCYYGIDIPSKDELIASHNNVEDIRKYLGVDSLHYLSIEGMYKSVSEITDHFCDACFTGKYPLKHNGTIRKELFETGLSLEQAESYYD